MGEAKRRQGKPIDRTAQVEIRDPTDHEHVPGTLTVYVLHDSGASFTATVPLETVDEAIRLGGKFANELGENVRQRTRDWIHYKLIKGEHISNKAIGETIAVSALWLAWTAPEPQRAIIREALRSDRKLALAITTHSVYGRPAIVGRTMLFPPDAELAEILSIGMGPTTEVVTRHLAPH